MTKASLPVAYLLIPSSPVTKSFCRSLLGYRIIWPQPRRARWKTFVSVKQRQTPTRLILMHENEQLGYRPFACEGEILYIAPLKAHTVVRSNFLHKRHNLCKNCGDGCFAAWITKNQKHWMGFLLLFWAHFHTTVKIREGKLNQKVSQDLHRTTIRHRGQRRLLWAHQGELY